MKTYFYPKDYYDEMDRLKVLGTDLQNIAYFDLNLEPTTLYDAYDVLIRATAMISKTSIVDFCLAIRFMNIGSVKVNSRAVGLYQKNKPTSGTHMDSVFVSLHDGYYGEICIAKELNHSYSIDKATGEKLYAGILTISDMIDMRASRDFVFKGKPEIFDINKAKYIIPEVIYKNLG